MLKRHKSKTDEIAKGLLLTFKNLGIKWVRRELEVAHKSSPSKIVKHSPTFYLTDYKVFVDTPNNTNQELEDTIGGNADCHVSYMVIRNNSFANLTSKDSLQVMLLHQKIFTSNFQISNLSMIDREMITKEIVLCLTDETFELLRECNWKTHRKSRSPVNRENIKEEAVDILKFFLNIINLWDISPDELKVAFDKKTKKVWGRFFGTY